MAIESLYHTQLKVYLPQVAEDGQGGETLTYPTTPDFEVMGRVSQVSEGPLESGGQERRRIQASLYHTPNQSMVPGVRLSTDTVTDWSDGSFWDDGSFWVDVGIWEIGGLQVYRARGSQHHQKSLIFRPQRGV